MGTTAKLVIRDKEYELPVAEGSQGEKGLDVSKLRGASGAITFDPGYGNTASSTSAITYIDGDAGVLRYRGIPIEVLAAKATFLEVAYLLIYGSLPAQDVFDDFKSSMRMHTMLHEDMKTFFGAFPKDAHPMAVLSAAAGALSTFYPDELDPRDPHQVEVSVHRLIAKMPTLAAYAHKHSVGQPFMYPRDELSYIGNFLHMVFANPCEDYEPDPMVEKAIATLFIVQADHEQDCSTSCVRLVGSSMVNLFGAISAGINALWGPQHSGENRAVIQMLQDMSDGGVSARAFVEGIKKSGEPSPLMGFGHRIYKDFDPRGRIIKNSCFDVVNSIGVNNKLTQIAVELEEISGSDPYFAEHGLFPNIEFYSAVIYNTIGIPMDMFTVLSAIGRLPGWIAQWSELHADPSFKIGRPRQIYTGPTMTDYTPIDERR